MREDHSEQEEDIQAFLRWANSSQTRRPGVGGSSHVTQCDFIPPSAVKEYLGADGRVEALLTSIFPNEEPITINPEAIRQHYLRTFAILLLIGKGPMIKHFVRYRKLQDQHLPYETRSEDFPFSQDKSFFDRFCENQWQFCATDLDYDMNLHLHKEEILPIITRKEVGHGGNAVIYKIDIHEDYDKLVPPHWKIPERPAHLRHTFVLKTYRGGDAKKQYEDERNAFMKLRYDSKPIPFVIGYYGSFEDKDTYNIILEYADQGNLEDFMASRSVPSTNEQMIECWDRFCQITHGLAHIHGIPVSADTGKQAFVGWHQDIKPANILVFSGIGLSEFDVYFKIADLSLCHFKQFDSIELGDSDLDTFGTRAYGAPETFRGDDKSPYFPLQVRPDVDIWSLGCVFSEVLVWSCLGWNRVLQYRRDRQIEVEKCLGLDGEHLFHDSIDVLPSVRDVHGLVLKKAGSDNHLIAEILRLVEDEMLLKEGEPRCSAKQVFHKSKRIIDSSRKKSNVHIPNIPKLDEDAEHMTDPDEEPQTPPNVPPGYIKGSSPSAWNPTRSRIDTSFPARPMSVTSVGSFSPSVRSATEFRWYHSKASRSDAHDSPSDQPGSSLASPSTDLRDLPDPPSPASSYQSSIDRFDSLTLRTHDLNNQRRQPRRHRETVANIANGAAKKAPREASMRRSQTEKRPTFRPRNNSASSNGSNSEPSSPTQVKKSQLPTPPSSSKKHSRSKSTQETESKVSPDHPEHQQQKDPERPHLSLQKGLLWKERKKAGYASPLKGCENLANLNERDHIFVIDNTESMRMHRINAFKVVSLLAYLLKDSDPNGLDICFTQSTEKKNSGSATKISEVVSKVPFNGVSDMRTCLSRIFQEHKNKFGTTSPRSWYRRLAPGEPQKPLSFYILTDGKWQPNEVGPVITALVDSMKELKLPKEHVGIQFIRFGQDPRGIERLNHLDHGLGLKEVDMQVDIVDTTWWNGNVWKQLLGAISSWYDDDPD